MKRDDILTTARDRFKQIEDADAENRRDALEDLRFANGDQWPEKVKDDRETDGRPCLTINRIPAFVRQVVNDIRQIRPSIKIRGVDQGSDKGKADVLNGMVRAIEAASNAEAAYDWAAEHSVLMGFGYWRVNTDYESDEGFQQCISISRIRNQFSVGIDPAAEQADGSDANFAFIVEYRDKEKLKAQYGGEIADWPEFDNQQGYDDWYTQDKARVAEYWCVEEEPVTITLLSDGNIIEGEIPQDDISELAGVIQPVSTRKTSKRRVVQRLITGDRILEETEWPGQYIPVVRVLGDESVIDGEVRYKGMVRDMRDPQLQYNYMRSASVERIATYPKAPFIGAVGAFSDSKWRRANIKNFAYLEYEPIAGAPPPARQAPPDISPGLVSEVQHAAEELKAVTGIYDPGLGNQSREIAGTAINARKLESDVSNYHYVDNLARAIRYTGKILVDLIPKVYNDQRMMTIIHGDGEEEQIQLNAQYVDQQTQKPRDTQLSVGRYDVSVDIGPSYTTQRQEAADSMIKFLQAVPAAQQVTGDLIAQNMDWPNSEEIAKRMKALMPPQVLAGESPQLAAMMQQMQQKDQMAQQMIGQLQQQIQILSIELQKQQQRFEIDKAKIAEDARQANMDHVEGMTKLEIEAAKDLSPQGLAY